MMEGTCPKVKLKQTLVSHSSTRVLSIILKLKQTLVSHSSTEVMSII